MGNLYFPKRIRLPHSFVCLSKTLSIFAQNEITNQKTEKREERKKLNNHNYNRLGSVSRPYYLILISHLFHTTRHRHLVDDFTARLEGPMYQSAPPPLRTRSADPPHA